MVRYELKKVFGSVGGKIALILYIAVLALSCWLSSTGALNVEVKWVNEQGESEYGPSAVKKLRETQKEWEGWVDQNKLSRVIQENQRINATPEAKSDVVQQNEIAYSWKQGFAPIRKILNESCSDVYKRQPAVPGENQRRHLHDAQCGAHDFPLQKVASAAQAKGTNRVQNIADPAGDRAQHQHCLLYTSWGGGCCIILEKF